MDKNLVQSKRVIIVYLPHKKTPRLCERGFFMGNFRC
jgi:hypothetical protein